MHRLCRPPPTRRAAPGWRLALAMVAFTLLLAVPAGPGAQAQSGERSSGAAILEAVVGVDARIPGTARTADTLGTRRQGSGVVISDDDLVVTIGYLIMEASEVELVLGDGRKVPADIVSYDHVSGLGILRARRSLGLRPVEMGTADGLTVSKQALIANRLGPQAAQGVFVVDRRTFTGAWEYVLEDAIFTAPPNPNFSGAALFGPDGTLIGVGYLFVGQAALRGRPLAGNMFVPIDELRPVFDELVANGRRSEPARPWLGIQPAQLHDRLFVERVANGSPAARAGVSRGDLILAVGDVEVHDMESFFRAVWRDRRAGDPVELTVLGNAGPPKMLTLRSMDRADWLRLDPSF